MFLKKNFIFTSISLTLSSLLLISNTQADWDVPHHGDKATPYNLHVYNLPSPKLTKQQKSDMEKADEAEKQESIDFKKYKYSLIKGYKFTEHMAYDFVEHALRQLPLNDFDSVSEKIIFDTDIPQFLFVLNPVKIKMIN